MTATIVERDSIDSPSERASAARRILIEAALLGVLADGVLRNAPDGLGWTLWIIALSLSALNVSRRRGVDLTIEQVSWLVAAVGCAAAFSWRDAEALRVANVFGTLVAVTLYSMCAAGLPAASIFLARLRDVIAAGVFAFRDVIAGAPVLAWEAELHRTPAVRRGSSWSAVRAVLLAAPLVLVFGLLLSRADPVLARIFRLPQIDAELIVSHVVVAGAFAWWSAGFIRGALPGVARRPALPDELPVRLGLPEITTSLGALAALFALFVALQLRWLFGGADLVLATTGLTVAEYARRGFFELVAVAALIVPVILGSRALIVDEKVVRRHRQLSLALLVLLAPIMASAMLRMKLYVEHFGLSTDRLYAVALMAWLGVVFIAMARTVFAGWARPFAAMTVISGFATLFALNVVNPDQLVARVNVGRSSVTREIDYVYLAHLGGDAMAVVAKALTTAAPSQGACQAAQNIRERWSAKRPRAWNLGAERGRKAVANLLSEAQVARLCAGVVLPPAASAPR